MSGWKTWLAAFAAVFYGVVGMIAGMHGPDEMATFVINGFALVGIGHKIDKAGGSL